MPRFPRRKGESGIYHVMVRGSNRQDLFHDDEDRHRFLGTLQRYKVASALEVPAWCLMGNHVHLLLREGSEPISATMKRMGVSYVRFFNQKYTTSGHLFQDRFTSEAVDNEAYLKTVVRYIHQNPVKAGLVKGAEDWPWSSCHCYLGSDSLAPGLTDPGFVLSCFADDDFTARAAFKVFSEALNTDQCLDIDQVQRTRLSDAELRKELVFLLKGPSIAQVKGLDKPARDDILRRAKAIDGASQRQLARVLGISPNLVYKA